MEDMTSSAPLKKWWILGIVVLVIILLVSFGRRAPAEKVKVGVLLPLSGLRADAGELSKNAILIAEKEINSDRSRSHQLQFIYEDTKYEPQTAVTAANKLISLDGVHYIIGPGGSSEVLAVAPVVEKNKTILIVHGAQSDEISQAGDYVFRIIHNMKQEAPVFAKYVAENTKGNRLDFLAINTAVADPYINNFKPIFEKSGKKVGLIEKFDSKAVDFRDLLTKLKANNSTDVLIMGVPKQVGTILKQAGELGLNAKFFSYGSEGSEIVQIGGKMAEGMSYPYSYDRSSASAKVKDFYDQYVKDYGKQPDALAANAYDAVYLISDCLKKVGDQVDLVKQCLYDTKDFQGAGGKFSIDSNGDAIKDIFIKTVKDGKFVKLGE